MAEKMTVAEAIQLLKQLPQHKLFAVDFDDEYVFAEDIQDFGDYVGVIISE